MIWLLDCLKAEFRYGVRLFFCLCKVYKVSNRDHNGKTTSKIIVVTHLRVLWTIISTKIIKNKKTSWKIAESLLLSPFEKIDSLKAVKV